MAASSEWHPVEEFDKTWPYTLAWGYSAQKDRAHAWKIPQGDDGSLLHRDQFAQHFGHPAQTRSGDQLGTAQFTPEETKWDGTAVAPAEMLLHTYYSAKPEDQVYEWFTEHFPDVIVRQAYVGKPKTAANKPLAWTWTEEEGPVLGRKDTGPKAWTGRVEFGPTVRIIPDRPDTPGHALSAIKTEVAKHHPDSEIGLPSATKPSTNPVSLLDHAAAVEWAHENLHREAAPVSDFIIGGKPYVGESIFSKLFKRKAEADMSGAMVAVFIPKEIGKKIKIRGGEPIENMHVTLVYFQSKADDRDDWDEVAKLVETIANQTPPLKAKIGGYGVFASTGEDKQEGGVLWATVDIPGLAELKVKLAEACGDAGFMENKEHGYTPHITLKYGWTGQLPELKKPIEFEIGELSFARGTKQEHFKLDGDFVKTTGWHRVKVAGYEYVRIPYLVSPDGEYFMGNPGEDHDNVYYAHEAEFRHPFSAIGQGDVNVEYDPETMRVLDLKAYPASNFHDEWLGETNSYDDHEVNPWGEHKYPFDEAHVTELARASAEHWLASGGQHTSSWEMSEWKWPGTVRFVTDGKEILTEPENQPEWDALDLTTLQQKFHSFYPDVKKVPACGWAIPTADGMGYGIWAPSIGYGNEKQLGLHDLVHTLDRELGKPTHFVEDWNHITDPKMYRSNHPD